MSDIRVNLKKRSYDILVGWGILNQLGKEVKKLNIGTDAYILTNVLIRKKYGKALESSLKRSGFNVRFKTVPDSEKSKSIATAADVIKDVALYDKKRRIFIVAFGGGVIGDLAGFVASIYKRGIPYIQVPTTLLAQVDSAIGGKTAVDLSQGKNLVGAFYQPRLVFSDTKLISSLSPRQVRSGFAEVIKYALIKDKKLFDYLEKKHIDLLSLKKDALIHVVGRCSAIKAEVVSKDEREEAGYRTILNFGHTAGHAIEAAAGFKRYTHGEAIALGMLVAIDIASHLKIADKKVAAKVTEIIRKFGLPDRIRGVNLSAIVNAHYRDKKFIGSINRFVLISGIGKVKVRRNVPLKVITKVLKARF
jgi:3-dehydroquinate synthase